MAARRTDADADTDTDADADGTDTTASPSGVVSTSGAASTGGAGSTSSAGSTSGAASTGGAGNAASTANAAGAERGEHAGSGGSGERSERADAARNRRAVLRATERLLAEGGGDHVSLDRVAALAGVGKGTVFRRFGSRAGLLQALLEERSRELREAVASGPPPLGPGAPARERLHAFLDGLGAIAEGNAVLLAAHEQACAEDRYDDPSYRFWHAHLSALFAAERPDLDADFLSHALLAVFDGDLIRHLTPPGDPRRFTRSVQETAAALLGPRS
ncbi:AcrR family transcriptional regulator [Nonomuraea thailandensis]|uniref:AcrR family transcriptional regulator n=1 Tax=Nonomuraea thailandensis TaxID=1188745 RepID=A0A9X2GH41_9ACTN|nr:TetR/AcrR family transcriptional regulator [Nonomuraea thailandensis]MCP2357705.1 AcrR family transcriptional regulator [Nonomuraea thailandensis]